MKAAVRTEEPGTGSIGPVAAGGFIIDPASDFTPDEARMYAVLKARDSLILADINAAAARLRDLYAARKLGFGPDPHWRSKLAEIEQLLDDLYASRRANLSRISVLLGTALRRKKQAKRAAPDL